MKAKVKSTGKILDVYAYEKDGYLHAITYIDYVNNTIYKTEDLEFLSEEEAANLLTDQKAYDDYQEREPFVMAAGGICYMLLSALQALWQTVTFWIIKNRIKRDGLLIDDYPQWVGGGAWVFYYIKMAVITATATYAFWHFIVLI